MHRQSLGSPASKAQIYGGKEENPDGEEREEKEELEKKGEKLHSSCTTEKFVHLIPVLLFFCLLVLYLFSYDPPHKDLVKIGDFRRFSSPKDSMETGNFDRSFLQKMGEVLAIYSHRSLHQIRKNDRKSHRKLGDF